MSGRRVQSTFRLFNWREQPHFVFLLCFDSAAFISQLEFLIKFSFDFCFLFPSKLWELFNFVFHTLRFIGFYYSSSALFLPKAGNYDYMRNLKLLAVIVTIDFLSNGISYMMRQLKEGCLMLGSTITGDII